MIYIDQLLLWTAKVVINQSVMVFYGGENMQIPDFFWTI